MIANRFRSRSSVLAIAMTALLANGAVQPLMLTPAYAQGPESVADLAAAISPAVVNIST